MDLTIMEQLYVCMYIYARARNTHTHTVERIYEKMCNNFLLRYIFVSSQFL